MRSYSLNVNGHRIELSLSIWSGKERVLYDGRLMSEKRSFLYVTPHSFEVTEGTEKVVYEVNILTGMGGYGYIVRRNGIVVGHAP
jgi:hypothetical protein